MNYIKTQSVMQVWGLAFAVTLFALLFVSFAQARDEFHYRPLPLDEHYLEPMDEGEDDLYIPSVVNPNVGVNVSAQGQPPAYSREEMMKKARGIGGEAGKQLSPEELRELQEKYRAVKGVMQEKRFEGKPDPNQCICTMEYMPVCGMTQEGEFKTFSNKCQLKCAGAKFVSKGECQAKGGKQIKKPPFGETGPFDPAPLPAKVKEMKKQWEDEDGNPMPMPWENKRETEDRGVEDFNGGTPPFYPEMRVIDIEDLLNPTGPTFPSPERRAIREGGRIVHPEQAKGASKEGKFQEEYGLEPVSAAPVMVSKEKNKNRGAQMPPVELELKALPKMLIVAPEKAEELQNKWLPIKRATIVKVDGDTLEAEEIKLNEDKTLEVKAKKRAKLLGIFGVELELEAKVDAKGDIKEIKKPWWSFLAW